MNQNYAVGIVALIVLVGGGVWYLASKGTGNTDIATTTPPIVQNNTNTNTVTPPKTEPVVVTNTTVSPSDNTAIVNGSVNPKGAFTSYWYEYGTNSNLGSKTANQTIGSGSVPIQAPGYIINLTKNITYYFKLVAENQYGRVAGNQFSFRTTDGTPAPVGSAPTTKTVSASGVSRTTANINGEVTPNKASTQYWFEYGKSAELGNTSAFSGVDDGAIKTPVSISLSDLEPLTTYYFRLNAQNQFGTINGSILNFKTLGPTSAKIPSVTTGGATNIVAGSAILHGTVTPNLAETKYWFEYSTRNSLSSETPKTTDPVLVGAGAVVVLVDKSVTNLVPNATYYFRIVAQNSQGTVRGDEVSFKSK